MSIKTRVGKIIEVINQNKKKASSELYEAVLLRNATGVHPFLFTKVELEVAYSRARKSPEDVVTQSFISRLID
jgi:hypothetical protein